MTVTLEQAQLSLSDLIARTSHGEQGIITQGDRPVAELRTVSTPNPTPIFGSCRGMLEILVEDDEHLADFAEYMR